MPTIRPSAIAVAGLAVAALRIPPIDWAGTHRPGGQDPDDLPRGLSGPRSVR